MNELNVFLLINNWKKLDNVRWTHLYKDSFLHYVKRKDMDFFYLHRESIKQNRKRTQFNTAKEVIEFITNGY